MKTITEIAKMLNLGRQTVYKRIHKDKSGELEAHKHFNGNGVLVLDDEGIELFKKLFDITDDTVSSSMIKDDTEMIKDNTYINHDQELITSLNEQITYLKEQIKIKDEQLKEKDKQVDQSQQLLLQAQSLINPRKSLKQLLFPKRTSKD